MLLYLPFDCDKIFYCNKLLTIKCYFLQWVVKGVPFRHFTIFITGTHSERV